MIDTKQITELLSQSQEVVGSAEIPDMNDLLDNFVNASLTNQEQV
jgi:hypothetical protein